MMKGVVRHTVAVVGAAVLGSAAWLGVSAGPAAAASYSPQVTLPFTGLGAATGVAVDAAGDVYVADTFNDRVVELPAGATSSSQQVTLPFTGLSLTEGVAVDAQGNVYVADTGNNRVVELPVASTLILVMFIPRDTVVGVPFSQSLGALGGTPPYTWSLVSGSLPTGLSLSTSGVISGTPTVVGTSSFTVQVTDSSLPPQTATSTELSITVLAPLAVTTSTLPDGQLGTAYSQTLAATGGTTPYTWLVLSGSLPAGLSLSTSGVISGTPTAAGTSSFTVEVADSSRPQLTASASLSITVGGCTTTITGTHSGPLTIGSGTTCLDQATITGPVKITTGAVVSITGSKLGGPLSASSPGSLAVCGTAVSGPVSVTDATGAVLLGGTSTSPCGSDSFGGPVTLSANTDGVTLAGTTVSGPATVNSNSGGTVVAGNTIGGPLSCSGNNPPPTDEGQPNTVSGPATGQCSSLA